MFKSLSSVLDSKMAEMDWYDANRVNWCGDKSVNVTEEWLDHVDECRVSVNTSSWLDGVDLI